MSLSRNLMLAAVSAAMFARCEVVTPTLGSDVRNVEIKATTTAGRAVTVTATADGKLVRLVPLEGSTVSAGQIVAMLSNPAFERDYDLARAQVALANANARRSTPLPTPMASSFAVARVDTALSLVLENKRAKLERYRQLRRRNDISQQELEDAENEYAWAQRDYLTQREAAVPAVDEGSAAALQLELVKARADERAARERFNALRIAAPISGTVTAVHAVQGQAVYTRDPLLEVTDLSTIEVRGIVAPDIEQYVQAGTPVDVRVFSVPPRTYHVAVDHVVPSAPNTSGCVVVVRLPNADGQLKPNTPAKITARF